MGWGTRMMSGKLSCELSDGVGGFVVKMMMIMWDTFGWRFCQKGWWKSNIFQMGGMCSMGWMFAVMWSKETQTIYAGMIFMQVYSFHTKTNSTT